MGAIKGGAVFTPSEIKGNEYLPNKGVFLSPMLGKPRGDGFGFYLGKIDPGCGIAPERHTESSETVYVLHGQAVGLIGEQEVSLAPGKVMHVDPGVPHGIRNTGKETLEILIIGHPDF